MTCWHPFEMDSLLAPAIAEPMDLTVPEAAGRPGAVKQPIEFAMPASDMISIEEAEIVCASSNQTARFNGSVRPASVTVRPLMLTWLDWSDRNP